MEGFGVLLKIECPSGVLEEFKDVEDAECTKVADLVLECEAGRSDLCFLPDWSPLLKVNVRLRGLSFFGLSISRTSSDLFSARVLLLSA